MSGFKMNEITKGVILFLLTVLCGAGVATLETPLNFCLLLIWLAFLVGAVRRQRRQLKGRQALTTAIVHGGAMFAIMTAAILAPGKRIDLVRETVIQLPAATMTISQLPFVAFPMTIAGLIAALYGCGYLFRIYWGGPPKVDAAESH
jgi:hypothetical protein